jgi:predicted transcriptional regulator
MISLDVLEDYDVVVRTHAHKNTLPKLSQQELIVYTLIMENSLDLESIITSLGMQSKDTTQQISLLELKGLIKKDISGKYRIS